MDHDEFMVRLHGLARDASGSGDPQVRRAAVVLFGLLGAAAGGMMFFDQFVRSCAKVIESQLQVMQEVDR